MKEGKQIVKKYGDYMIVAEENHYGVIKSGDVEWLIDPDHAFIDYYVDENIFMGVQHDEDNEYFLFYDNNGALMDFDYKNLQKAYGFCMGICVIEESGLLNVINVNGDRMLKEGAVEISAPTIEDDDIIIYASSLHEGSVGEKSRYILRGNILEKDSQYKKI